MNRKAKRATKSEARHLDKVANLACCLCGIKPVELHHILEGRIPGRRSSHWTTIPLCVSCHRGPKGIHGDKAMLKIMKTTEIELLAKVLEAVYG